MPGPTPGPGTRAAGSRYVRRVAGFRMGRGDRDNRTAQGQQAHAPQGPTYGGQAPHHGQRGPAYGYPQGRTGHPQGNQYGYPGPANDGPEYFGDPGHGGHDPYPANQPGHTQAFSIDEASAYTQGETYHAGSAQPPGRPARRCTGRNC